MQLGMVGLGKMGMNMARRLVQGGHEVVVYNRTPAKTREMVDEGAVGSFTLPEMVGKLALPRTIWLMLPAGKPVDDVLDELKDLLAEGDTVIEGGNTFYKDDLRRTELLAGRNVNYLDVGVSGGIWGLKIGYCMMIGGPRNVFERLQPIFETLAPPEGYLYCGPSGAGHFVKMVHNGIEYGMMQAYGEGFALLESSPYGGEFDFGKIAHLWNQGSVVRSWLLELLEDAFAKDPRLADLQGFVEDSGEGRWTVNEAVASGVATPVIALSLFARFQSRQEDLFQNRVLAALRQEFGGHAVVKAREK